MAADRDGDASWGSDGQSADNWLPWGWGSKSDADPSSLKTHSKRDQWEANNETNKKRKRNWVRGTRQSGWVENMKEDDDDGNGAKGGKASKAGKGMGNSSGSCGMDWGNSGGWDNSSGHWTTGGWDNSSGHWTPGSPSFMSVDGCLNLEQVVARMKDVLDEDAFQARWQDMLRHTPLHCA